MLKIYFYRMSGKGISKETMEEEDAVDSDCIVINVNNHWGIIDSGHRYENTIIDSDGTEYQTPANNYGKDGEKRIVGLSSQIQDLNGRDFAVFLHKQLKIDHLDFVIATHSHSDHIGGIPYIANYEFLSEDGKKQYLINQDTVFFYKPYYHVNDINDDLENGMNPDSYHNQAFFFQSLSAMAKRNAILIDVSAGGIVHSEDNGWVFDQKPDFQELPFKTMSWITNLNDPIANNILINYYGIEVRLFNLYAHSDVNDENANSIVTVIKTKNINVLLGGDINCEYRIEQLIAERVVNTVGNIDIMKMNHHAYNGSNSSETLEIMRPTVMICTRYCYEGWDVNDRTTPLRYYLLKSGYNSNIYESGLSDKALVLVDDGEEYCIYNLREINGMIVYQDASSCINHNEYSNGWFRWDRACGDKRYVDWYFFNNGEPVVGWNRIAGSTIVTIDNERGYIYFFDEAGRMKIGWQIIDEDTYFFADGTIPDYPTGAMIVGTHSIDGIEYMFLQDGSLNQMR